MTESNLPVSEALSTDSVTSLDIGGASVVDTLGLTDGEVDLPAIGDGETGGGDVETSGGGEGENPIVPFPSTSNTENPPAETSKQDIGRIVVITPDGVTTMYADNTASTHEEIVQLAKERWLKDNGAMQKPFQYYSVSEGLLFIIAACALVWLFCKIFKRSKL